MSTQVTFPDFDSIYNSIDEKTTALEDIAVSETMERIASELYNNQFSVSSNNREIIFTLHIVIGPLPELINNERSYRNIWESIKKKVKDLEYTDIFVDPNDPSSTDLKISLVKKISSIGKYNPQQFHKDFYENVTIPLKALLEDSTKLDWVRQDDKSRKATVALEFDVPSEASQQTNAKLLALVNDFFDNGWNVEIVIEDNKLKFALIVTLPYRKALNVWALDEGSLVPYQKVWYCTLLLSLRESSSEYVIYGVCFMEFKYFLSTVVRVEAWATLYLFLYVILNFGEK